MRILCLLAMAAVARADIVESGEFRYGRDINELANMKEELRVKRQASGVNATYYVTPCQYDVTDVPDGPSIKVSGVEVRSEQSVVQAARLIHLMTRFMPRSVFERLAAISSVGIFPVSGLPEAFVSPEAEKCQLNCRQITLPDGSQFDCSIFCTTSENPFSQPMVPLYYLWAYGNQSTTFVVETNIMCGTGYNPAQESQNLLVREFGLNVMLYGMDEATRADLDEAFTEARDLVLFQSLGNVYGYFMKATMTWFNAVKNNNLGGMACKYINGPDGRTAMCADTFQQRQYLKTKDLKLYNILNKVYNNDREYAESGTDLCQW